ncbi:hypothetical protein FOL46_002602 [Perkinsus olseni]|uniref:Uncharacterized protein n=1 Tax=Perkinsus olseni TaxID=32597 RepID=A0A7J6M6R3_PEROL|nr:hypothetical protein FOL46_002602 [Perkinsus olseni]
MSSRRRRSSSGEATQVPTHSLGETLQPAGVAFCVSDAEGALPQPPKHGAHPLTDRLKALALKALKRLRLHDGVVGLDELQQTAKQSAEKLRNLSPPGRWLKVSILGLDWHPQALVALRIPPPVEGETRRTATSSRRFTVKMHTLDLGRSLETNMRATIGNSSRTIPVLHTHPVEFSCGGCVRHLETAYENLEINQNLPVPERDINQAPGLFFIFELIVDDGKDTGAAPVAWASFAPLLQGGIPQAPVRLRMYHTRYRSHTGASKEMPECPDTAYDVASPARHPIPGLMLVVNFQLAEEESKPRRYERSSNGSFLSVPYDTHIGSIDLDNDSRGALRISLSPDNKYVAVARQGAHDVTGIAVYSLEHQPSDEGPIIETERNLPGQVSTVEFGSRLWSGAETCAKLDTPRGLPDHGIALDRSYLSSLLYVGNAAGGIIAYDTSGDGDRPEMIGSFEHPDLLGIPVWHIRVITYEFAAATATGLNRVDSTLARKFRYKTDHDILMMTMADSTIRIVTVPREVGTQVGGIPLTPVMTLRGSSISNSIPRADISPDGRFVVCGSSNGVLHLWDVCHDGAPINDGCLKVVVPGIIADVVWSRSHYLVLCAA